MYFTYCDESGKDGKSPVFVMAGIVTDVSRYRRASAEFQQLFETCSLVAKDGLTELKASDVYHGNAKWRDVTSEDRKRVFEQAILIAVNGKHRIALAAVENSKAKWPELLDGMPTDIWMIGGLHIALQLQRAHSSKQKNKGLTLIVVDEAGKAPALSELLLDPPVVTDDFYSHSGGPRLSAIMDTVMIVKSHHFGMVQLADMYAFIFRRFLEVSRGTEKYEGELERLTGWVDQLGGHLLKRSHRWPRIGVSEVSAWYAAVAPLELQGYKGK